MQMWVATIHRIHIRYAVPTGRPASDNCPSDFAKTPSLWAGPPCTILWLGRGGRQGLVSASKWCSRPLFGMAVSVHTGGYPSQHGASNFCGIFECLLRLG